MGNITGMIDLAAFYSQNHDMIEYVFGLYQNQINDVFLNATYNNQFIWQDFKFSYEYNNKEKDLKEGKERKNALNTSIYFNSTFDAAGNLLYLFRERQDTLNGQYLLRNQPQ